MPLEGHTLETGIVINDGKMDLPSNNADIDISVATEFQKRGLLHVHIIVASEDEVSSISGCGGQ